MAESRDSAISQYIIQLLNHSDTLDSYVFLAHKLESLPL